MDQSAIFWNNIAARYAQRPVGDEASYQKKLQITQKYLKPDMEVLEFGCGTGSTAIIHAPYVKHTRAVDISEKMIDIARSKADVAGIDNITFEVAPCDGLEVPDESLDAVMGMSILHLLEDKEAMIARVYRMLKPGGLFISSTVCMSGMMALIKPVISIMRLFGKAPETVKCFSVKSLVKSLTDTGFEIDQQWQPSKAKAVFIVAKKPDS